MNFLFTRLKLKGLSLVLSLRPGTTLRLLLSLLCLAITSLTFAQQDPPYQQVILVDGNVLRGKLLENDKPAQVSIQTFSGAIFHIEKTYIKRVVEVGADQKVFSNGKTINTSKIYTNAFWGVMLAKEEDRWNEEELKVGYTLLHLSLGHRFNPYFSLGGGISWDQYDQTLFSFFTEVRGNMVNHTMSPYYVLRAGYGVPVFNSTQDDGVELSGGYSFHPAIGMRFATHQKTNVLIEAGYRFQQMTMEYEDFFNTKDKLTLRRLSIRFGLDF